MEGAKGKRAIEYLVSESWNLKDMERIMSADEAEVSEMQSPGSREFSPEA